ncbi:glycosyltransferase [Nonlabens xiamenensis]|uniref:glycosyltransferase n=1 Tax=Nonlabens xiamenensis TaxID=2341043 RepID=UPI000F60D680|nr:glycosyltransferase [Nonlabens xiamenensis]
MKVLQLIDSLDAGGAERMAVNIANAMARAGQPAFLCASRKEGMLKSQIDDRVNYLFAEREGKLGIRGIVRIKNFVQEHDIQIIHAHATSFFAASMTKILLPHLLIVWHDHYGKSENLDQRDAKLIKVCKGFFNAVIAVNTKLQEWATKELGIHSSHYLANFTVPSDDTNIDNELPGQSGKRIVCLANLRPQKDQITLIDAFAKLDPEFQQWTLHICGKDFNNTYSRKLKSFIQESRLEERVFLHGSRTDIPGVLSSCDIGVLSSISEGLPLALLEYGLYGLPVVSTDVGACAEVIGEDGLLVSPSDPWALKTAFQKLISNPELGKALATRFHQKILANYGEEQYLAQLQEIYKAL